jgi:threonine/homoserine/homoserine lactone efflux protein
MTELSLAAIGGMALTALWLVLTPGPNMVYLVSRSISQGRSAGLVSLAGTGVGFVIYMTMANLGLSTVFSAVPWLYIGLKAVGVVYLLWLAWKALKPNGVGVFEVHDLRNNKPFTLFRMGLLTNLLNPKAAIMYVALIPQFINPAGGNAVAQGFLLGSIQITVSMIINALIVIAAGSIARFLSANPRWLRLQRRITGTMLGIVAVCLAREVHSTAHALP